MLLSPPVLLSARLEPQNSGWELVLRYLAATTATLLAIAGAQLVTSNSFIFVLTALTLVGVPVSLWLRLCNLRVGGWEIPRPLLNSLTVIASAVSAFYMVIRPMSDFFVPILTGNVPSSFWLRFGAGEPVSALMQLFLLFAAFRSFALISDKDATLTTVPSFSVLLLLIPIHQGIEVVFYFVAWTFVAATLFALDHRSEVRAGVSATIPALVAGQDVRLGARSLATVLGLSLIAAIGISLFLAFRTPDDRSSTQSAVAVLAARLTNMVLALPEISPNSGPERQIDFKNGPNLPSMAHLWQVDAVSLDRQTVRPAYWRMFSLSNYNGVSWTQSDGGITRVKRVELQRDRWPFRRQRGSFDFRGQSPSPNFRLGFDVDRENPAVSRQFGKSGVLVHQTLTSLVPNIGFLPVQPAVRAIRIIAGEQKEVRLRNDGAVDVGIVQIGQSVRVLSDVPPLAEYGVAGRHAPVRRLSDAQIAKSGVALSPTERALNLKLPATLPERVRRLSAEIVKRAAPDASNAAKAQRLALAVQENAVYTLRPPAIPEGRDATDFFLFQGARRGYCTYFAGALTVLCRAQGIPARVVSGFAGMQWSGPDAGLLREGNAHAWTEIWVDGFGWAVVDATPFDDRGDNAPTWIESWADWVFSQLNSVNVWAATHQIALVSLASTLICFWVWGRAHGWRRVGWTWKLEHDDDFERRSVTKVYHRTSRSMARKFRPKTAWETPDEWLQNCARSLSASDTESLRRLTALYLAARYDERPLPRGSARLARETAASVGWKKTRNRPSISPSPQAK